MEVLFFMVGIIIGLIIYILYQKIHTTDGNIFVDENEKTCRVELASKDLLNKKAKTIVLKIVRKR